MTTTEVQKHPDFPKDWKWPVTRPLEPGTVIDFEGIRATVAQDMGGDKLWVLYGGHKQDIRWSMHGASCTVVSAPPGLPWYETIDDYNKDFPLPETAMAWFKSRRKSGLSMFRIDEDRCLHPGNYASLSYWETVPGITRLYVSDGDDGFVIRDLPTVEVPAVIAEMRQALPLDFPTLRSVFNFEYH